MEPRPPALGAWSLSHRPTREVPCVLFSLKPSLIPTVPLSPSAPPQSQRPFSRDTLWKSVSFSSLRGESEMQRGVWHGFCPTALSYPSVPPLKFPGVPSPSHPCQKQGVPLGLEHHSAVPMPALFKGHVSSRKGRCLREHLLDHMSQARGQWQSRAQIAWDPTQGSPYSVRGRSTLRDPICCFLPLCAVSQGLSVPYQFLENRNEPSCMQVSGLRSGERAPAWIPFSVSL